MHALRSNIDNKETQLNSILVDLRLLQDEA